MKIGILTHHYVNNYGAFLQAYALLNAVQELFPEDNIEIIDYLNVRHFVINTGGWFRFYKDRENLKSYLQKIKLPRTFAHARNAHLKMSKRVYNPKQVNKLGYDVILVGSDEVWNFKDKKANDPVKFGQGLTCQKLIAYAPSVGKTRPTEELPGYVQDGIKRFSALSARDDLTFELAGKISGKEVTRVLDPTFLGTFEGAPLAAKKKPYILFYYCEKLPKDIQKQIFDYAKEHDLGIYGAGECNKEYTDVTVNLTPFEWVEMFRNAEFVFTGTFHGAVFSILCKKQFKVYLTNESRIKKVGALLKELGIENREMTKDYVFDPYGQKEEINYEQVYRVIGEKRRQSLDYLRSSIEDKA
ncbi:MAG: polysaccharide pyruvyl transferase family protein [Butyrivibrio sp.]|nr:polysaccharide pyruvyl transferase family protein [Butyrivibrio sp.]